MTQLPQCILIFNPNYRQIECLMELILMKSTFLKTYSFLNETFFKIRELFIYSWLVCNWYKFCPIRHYWNHFLQVAFISMALISFGHDVFFTKWSNPNQALRMIGLWSSCSQPRLYKMESITKRNYSTIISCQSNTMLWRNIMRI